MAASPPYTTLPGVVAPVVACPSCAKRLHLLGINDAARVDGLPGPLVGVACHACEFAGLVPAPQLDRVPSRVCTADQFAPAPPRTESR